MKTVFLAAPYRSDTDHGMYMNIHRAGELAVEIWKMGAACICPHKNSAMFSGVVPEQFFLDGYLGILDRCDAVMLAPGWLDSTGARGEAERARARGIPAFESLDALREWLDDAPTG